MTGRGAQERHRSSTPLECLFDLCFVVAVAQAGVSYEHLVVEGRAGHALVGYVFVFFAIWWAWMNFSWFASGWDTDDVLYRIAVFVQILGALTIAAGVEAAVTNFDFTVVTWGYVLIRVSGVAQWVRAAASDDDHRRTAVRQIIGVTAVQLGWVLRLYALPASWALVAFAVLVVAELAVPAWAQLGEGNRWHPEHIGDRYGLFTLIVLGEAVTSAALAVKAGLAQEHERLGVLVVAGSAAALLYAMWWLYFDRTEHEQLSDPRFSFLWGYAHYLIFAGVAALGAGLSVSVEHLLGHDDERIPNLLAAVSVTGPVAVVLLTLWGLRAMSGDTRVMRRVLPAGAGLALLATFTPVAVPLAAGIVVAVLVVALTVGRPMTSGGPPAPGADPAPGGDSTRGADRTSGADLIDTAPGRVEWRARQDSNLRPAD